MWSPWMGWVEKQVWDWRWLARYEPRRRFVEYISYQAGNPLKRSRTKENSLRILDMQFKAKERHLWRVWWHYMFSAIALEGRMLFGLHSVVIFTASIMALLARMCLKCGILWHSSQHHNTMTKISRLRCFFIFNCFLNKRDFLIIIYFRDCGVVICEIMYYDYNSTRVLDYWGTSALDDKSNPEKSFW